MSEGSLRDALALFDAIKAKNGSDERLLELLGEVSTALAEILGLMEKQAEAEMREKPEGIDTNALAAALVAGFRAMPAPKLEMPAPTGKDWTELQLIPNRNVRTGAAESYSLKRIK
jgi:hypothetical protein